MKVDLLQFTARRKRKKITLFKFKLTVYQLSEYQDPENDGEQYSKV